MATSQEPLTHVRNRDTTPHQPSAAGVDVKGSKNVPWGELNVSGRKGVEDELSKQDEGASINPERAGEYAKEKDQREFKQEGRVSGVGQDQECLSSGRRRR